MSKVHVIYENEQIMPTYKPYLHAEIALIDSLTNMKGKVHYSRSKTIIYLTAQ